MSYLYLWISIIPLVISCLLDMLVGKKLLTKKKFYVLLGVFLLLMLVFDSILTGLPIVQYVSERTLGITIGTMPVEDFFYGIAFVITILNIDVLFSYSVQDIRTLLLSSRPFSWINTAYPAIIALFLARGYFEISDIWYVIYFLIPYNLLVYGVNDVYDFASDSKNPRKQSIEGALLPEKLHAVMLWTSISLSLLFLPFFTQNMITIILYCLAVLLAIIYSMPPVRTKTKPLIDSITSSLHFVMPAVIGYSIGAGNIVWRVEFLSFFLWGMASHMLGAIPDVTPDKKAGMRTVATVLGEKKTALIVLILYCISAVILLPLGKPYMVIAVAIALYALLPLGYLNKRLAEVILFRSFMYYNLVTGFVVTIVVLLTVFNLW